MLQKLVFFTQQKLPQQSRRSHSTKTSLDYLIATAAKSLSNVSTASVSSASSSSSSFTSTQKQEHLVVSRRMLICFSIMISSSKPLRHLRLPKRLSLANRHQCRALGRRFLAAERLSSVLLHCTKHARPAGHEI